MRKKRDFSVLTFFPHFSSSFFETSVLFWKKWKNRKSRCEYYLSFFRFFRFFSFLAKMTVFAFFWFVATNRSQKTRFSRFWHFDEKKPFFLFWKNLGFVEQNETKKTTFFGFSKTVITTVLFFGFFEKTRFWPIFGFPGVPPMVFFRSFLDRFGRSGPENPKIVRFGL